MKRKPFLSLMMVLCLLMNFAWAECSHKNVNHHYVRYTILGSTAHFSESFCMCMDCGARLKCCPQPNATPPSSHSYNITNSVYSTANLNQHTVTLTYTCVCSHSYTDTISENHDYKYVSDYHGTGLKHYINYRCSLCNQTKTTTYTCSGNPCYMPALYRQPIEEE